jgi:hypothetical protein
MSLVLPLSFVVALLAVVIALRRWPRDHRWCFHDNDQMRRYIDQRWEYRPQTEAERQEAIDMEIW